MNDNGFQNLMLFLIVATMVAMYFEMKKQIANLEKELGKMAEFNYRAINTILRQHDEILDELEGADDGR